MEQLPLVEEPTPTQEPIKDVGTFWQRLDEVLDLIKTGGTRMDRVEEILKEFPEQVGLSRDFKSFLFQPERLGLSSAEGAKNITPAVFEEIGNILEINSNSGHAPAETFDGFRISFRRALVNVKSLQLLSAIIPTPVDSFPSNELCFFYYTLRKLEDSIFTWEQGTSYEPGDIVEYDGFDYLCLRPDPGDEPPNETDNFTGDIQYGNDLSRPNYFDINPYRIQVVALCPTAGPFPEFFNDPLDNDEPVGKIFNNAIIDYETLVDQLNACTSIPITCSGGSPITFIYNSILRKIQVYYDVEDEFLLPCGYLDPNIDLAWELGQQNIIWQGWKIFQIVKNNPSLLYTPGSGLTLNRRLGFTWNGSIQAWDSPAIDYAPYETQQFPDSLYYYLRPSDPIYTTNYDPSLAFKENYLTANTYPNLCHTGSVRVMCDAILGSTLEGGNQTSGLLSVVPVNTNELGVNFYQNNFDNPLTKIPRIITELGFRLVTDKGQPFILPSSADVILELAVDYH